MEAKVLREPDILLSYYSADMSLRRTNYYHPLVEDLNRKEILPSTLRFTSQEIALTAEMVDFHFSEIKRLTQLMDNAPTAELYFARAMEFAIIKDYASAVDDCSKAIPIADKDLETIICFCRATWRSRMTDADYSLVILDYDQVLRLQPSFVFALYNKANTLCIQRAWAEALDCYTRAIALDNDFAEAYFNRGLTYIYNGERDKGLTDLSKAGELGIYQAYNMISRFK